MSILNPTASEPDVIVPELKEQLRKLFLARPRVHVGRVSGKGGMRGGTVDIDSAAAWKSWALENKWGLLLISSLGAFLYYRWRYCREEDKPAIYASDFKPDPHYYPPVTKQPLGYGVPAMQSVSWRGNGMPMAPSPEQFMAPEPMASNQ